MNSVILSAMCPAEDYLDTSVNTEYYIPRPEASIARAQFVGDNRDRILFVCGTSGVGKRYLFACLIHIHIDSTLIRKCSEKEKSPKWIYCRNINNITKLSYKDIWSWEHSCVIFDDASELISNIYKLSKNSGPEQKEGEEIEFLQWYEIHFGVN